MKKVQKILVMGLPGSGKTTLAKLLAEKLNAVWLNADVIRKKNNDWDFSEEGRNRQAQRMLTLSKEHVAKGKELLLILFVRLKKHENTLMLTLQFGWTQ